MGGYRAKDADRDRYVDVIEAAYVDGQLGEQDRELRVSRALTAETLGELDALTRDLQDRPAPPAPPAPVPPPRVARSSRPGPAGGHRPVGKGVSGAVSVVVGVALLGAVLSMMQAEDDWAGGSPDHSQVPWEQLEAAEPAPGFAMTARGVRELVDAFEAEFGTLEAFEVAFLPRRVAVQVPVRGARPRMERWTWDGEWTRNTEAAAVVGPAGRVDLGAVDARRLVANIRTARDALRVERGRFTHALLTRRGAEPVELSIHIGNAFNESGHLSTTPAGEIVRRHRYDG